MGPRPRRIALRLGLANIHRAGAITPSVVLSLGLGLTLAATLAMVEGNLRNGIGGALADEAPDFFFVDIQPNEVEAFSDLVAKTAPQGTLEKVPMLRGRIMALWLVGFVGSRPFAAAILGGAADMFSVHIAFLIASVLTLAIAAACRPSALTRTAPAAA